jgi:hypothetical protein
MLIVLKQAEMTFFQPHQNPHGQDLPMSNGGKHTRCITSSEDACP